MTHSVEKKIRKKFLIQDTDTIPYVGRKKNSVREDIYDLFAELGYKLGAEIGVKRGKNALQMCQRIPDLKLICVDPWVACVSIPFGTEELVYRSARERLDGYDIIFKRMTSMEAAEEVEDSTLDFVYIDGAHDFDNVMMDLIRWSPKVRIGGIVSGHDYFPALKSGVSRAVDAYVFAHGIRDLYLTRRGIPSFFWVKTK